MFCYFLLFSPSFSLSSLALRPLHSFPTRRSSDLTVFNLFELGYLAATCRPEWTLSAILFTAAIALLLIAFTVGDRKSTRLNSSHVAISYAVFCLKKKKK